MSEPELAARDQPRAVVRQPRAIVAHVARGLLLAALLVGPALVIERLARNEVGLIPYLQEGYRYRLDAKKIMFRQVGCPSTVVVGTSMTEVALNAASLRAYRDDTGDDSFEPIFAFAAPGTRPIAMHGVWRWIQGQGCTPKFLFIEATPVILNLARGEDFERAFMDLRMQLDVSEQRFAPEAYTLKFRADLATWWRSFVYRNREPIMKYLKARFGDKRLKRLETIPTDGKLKPTSKRELSGKFFDSQYRNTMRTFRKREFKFEFSPAYVDAIIALAREAQSAGTRAIIHTPPVPKMFHEFMDVAGATEPFCAFYNSVLGIPEIRWYSEYGRTDLASTEFSDWLHVNRAGANRYAIRVLSVVAADEVASDAYCGQR